MSDYDNTNKGILFREHSKKSDKHPDYTGSININGVDHWLSAWIKDGKKGKFMSLSIGAEKQPKQDQHNEDNSNGYQEPDPFDDDICF